eukprot:11499592-Alexandrium_andersonii.AAC.1
MHKHAGSHMRNRTHAHAPRVPGDTNTSAHAPARVPTRADARPLAFRCLGACLCASLPGLMSVSV